MEKIVPLIGMNVKGPLGVAHLPRLWLKDVLGHSGVLADGYVRGYAGMNRLLMDALGLDPDATAAELAQRPSYPAFETWVREHAARIDPASVAAANHIVVSYQKSPEAAAEVRAAVGLTDFAIRESAVLNSLDDWATVHAQAMARRGGGLPPTVPAVSTQSVGALGLMHLPRFWMKATLNAAGALYPDWRSGPNSPLDIWFCEAIGLDLEAAIGFVQAELPPYPVFEAWAARHATHTTPPEIAQHNESLRTRRKPEAVAAHERALLGIDDPDYRPSMELNDLVDWHTLHAGLTETSAASAAGAQRL